MRKQELDRWLKDGGDLPENLTEDEESYLEENGWLCNRTYYENDFLVREEHYLDGRFHGEQRWFCESEPEKVIVKSYRHGEKHGVWEYYGRLNPSEELRGYHHGKPHGVWKSINDYGVLVLHKEYAYGILLKDHLKEEF